MLILVEVTKGEKTRKNWRNIKKKKNKKREIKKKKRNKINQKYNKWYKNKNRNIGNSRIFVKKINK